MISPPVYVFDAQGVTHTVYGWEEINGRFEPIVGNPDGPGIAAWHVYHGEDPYHTG
jgi:hypothetical protein